MDRLADGGLRYTNFHTTAMCSPTRAALLTGRQPHAVGMGIIAEWSTGFPAYRGFVSPRAANLAEMLGPHGYSTFAVGKWHLMSMADVTAAGPFDPLAAPARLRPLVRLPRRAGGLLAPGAVRGQPRRRRAAPAEATT